MNAAYIRIGLGGCDMGAGYLLPRLVGLSNASEFLLTGRFIDAERALRMGLVSEIVPAEKLLDTGLALAEDMLKAAPMGLRMTKEAINAEIDAPSLEAALAIEDRQQVILIDTDDHREAVKAFREKRAPTYRDVIRPLPSRGGKSPRGPLLQLCWARGSPGAEDARPGRREVAGWGVARCRNFGSDCTTVAPRLQRAIPCFPQPHPAAPGHRSPAPRRRRARRLETQADHPREHENHCHPVRRRRVRAFARSAGRFCAPFGAMSYKALRISRVLLDLQLRRLRAWNRGR